MRMTKLAAVLSTLALFSSQAALADITVGVSLSTTGPAASLGIARPRPSAFPRRTSLPCCRPGSPVRT